MMPILSENQRSKYLALEAIALGHGGIQAISKLTGASRSTITLGIKQVDKAISDPKARRSSKGIVGVRAKGAGRKSIEETSPGIKIALDALISESTSTNPAPPLSWTTKSLRILQQELETHGYKISHVKVGDLLKELGYSRQLNQKPLQMGEAYVNNDEQFVFINEMARYFIQNNEPVISVNTKKKESFDNKYRNFKDDPEDNPTLGLDRAFPILELDKANSSGLYAVKQHAEPMNEGLSNDTAIFVAQSIGSWWKEMGCLTYPEASKLYITFEGGSKNKLWEKSLQELSNDIGLEIHVSHFPPGTFRWKKIEQRLFSHISKNWRERPLVSLTVTISLIHSTTTKKALKVGDAPVTNTYRNDSKEDDRKLKISRHKFHGNWNYWVSPSNMFA